MIIVTGRHWHDECALAAVLDSPAKYIGLIGSHRKVEIIFRDLKLDGGMAQQLQRVHAPMALPIDVVRVEETAVTVVARLVEVRRADARGASKAPYQSTRKETETR